MSACEGASPNRRDYGRRLCAEEWARFCGRHSCADAIAKYIRSTKYFFTKTFLLAKDKWKSEPDLLQLGSTSSGGQHKATRRDSGGWLQRHLSLKRKKQQQQVNIIILGQNPFHQFPCSKSATSWQLFRLWKAACRHV